MCYQCPEKPCTVRAGCSSEPVRPAGDSQSQHLSVLLGSSIQHLLLVVQSTIVTPAFTGSSSLHPCLQSLVCVPTVLCSSFQYGQSVNRFPYQAGSLSFSAVDACTNKLQAGSSKHTSMFAGYSCVSPDNTQCEEMLGTFQGEENPEL